MYNHTTIPSESRASPQEHLLTQDFGDSDNVSWSCWYIDTLSYYIILKAQRRAQGPPSSLDTLRLSRHYDWSKQTTVSTSVSIKRKINPPDVLLSGPAKPPESPGTPWMICPWRRGKGKGGWDKHKIRLCRFFLYILRAMESIWINQMTVEKSQQDFTIMSFSLICSIIHATSSEYQV